MIIFPFPFQHKNVEKQSLAVEAVRVFSALLACSNTVKERLLKADLYSRLAEALQSLGDPRRPLLRELVALATEDDGLSLSDSESSLKVGHLIALFNVAKLVLFFCLKSLLVMCQLVEWTCTAYIAPMAPCCS